MYYIVVLLFRCEYFFHHWCSCPGSHQVTAKTVFNFPRQTVKTHSRSLKTGVSVLSLRIRHHPSPKQSTHRMYKTQDTHSGSVSFIDLNPSKKESD